jgi:putative hemolysin
VARHGLVPIAAIVVVALAGCSGDDPTSARQLANPASENCVANGGRVVIETAGDGGQYGVCLFEDNRQCEEWALLRGACPLGGLKVTGYVTPQARSCAIRGGHYAVTGEPTATTPEEGTCTLPGEPTCDALALHEDAALDEGDAPPAESQFDGNRRPVLGDIRIDKVVEALRR